MAYMSYLVKRSTSLLRRSATRLLLTGLGIATILGTPPLLNAQWMSSQDYLIQLGNFNLTSGTKSGGGYTVTDTVGQTAAGEFNSAGYTVKAGFQYLYTLPRFTFRILDLSIDLGELAEESFSTATNELVISTRSAGYSIKAIADHPLRKPGGIGAAAIPDTSCDSSCTISSATPWVDTDNVGFGFNSAGIHRSADFVDNTYFRPFASKADGDTSQTIASHTNIVKDDSITITYKATIPGNLEGGEYSTGIDYIAIPSY